MSSHSQFKRFNILQELEQAIKKKTHEKYAGNRSKSKTKDIYGISKPLDANNKLHVKSPVVEKSQKDQNAPQTRKTTQTNKIAKFPEFKSFMFYLE
jgi:hypothetical protein